ncbi:MAG: InlB B-repeat-containing protein, partial [Anaeroplasmataceae bacterium]|nr:InlB B-repeat-containing protein [Anaeroplasmataceae bacterium]
MKKISYFIGILCLLLLFTSCKTEKKVTAKFHSGEEIVSEKYDPNTVLTEDMFPDLEADEGYQVEKWYLDQNYETLVIFPYQLKEDTRFYLKWVPVITQNKVTIYLHNGDQTEEKSIDINTTLNQPQAEKLGYTFKGWSTNQNTYTPFDFTSVVTKDTHLYAFFDINTYKVTFYSMDTIYHTENVDYNQKVAKPTDPDGSTFKGWSTNKDTFEEYDFSKTITASLDLYAFYDSVVEPIKTYKVTFYDSDEIIQIETIKANQTVEQPTDPVKTGSTFKGWSTNKDSFVEFIFTSPIQKDTNLYAFYETNQYIVNYYVSNTLYKTQTINYNSTTTAPQDPTDSNLVFEGWYLEENFRTKFNFETPITNSINLYAKMVDPSIPTVTVEFMIDGKTTSQNIEQDSILNQPANPTKDGYTFKGWSTKENSYEAYDFTKPVSSKLTLYAFFDINSYTITFDVDNETST